MLVERKQHRLRRLLDRRYARISRARDVQGYLWERRRCCRLGELLRAHGVRIRPALRFTAAGNLFDQLYSDGTPAAFSITVALAVTIPVTKADTNADTEAFSVALPDADAVSFAVAVGNTEWVPDLAALTART